MTPSGCSLTVVSAFTTSQRAVQHQRLGPSARLGFCPWEMDIYGGVTNPGETSGPRGLRYWFDSPRGRRARTRPFVSSRPQGSAPEGTPGRGAAPRPVRRMPGLPAGWWLFLSEARGSVRTLESFQGQMGTAPFPGLLGSTLCPARVPPCPSVGPPTVPLWLLSCKPSQLNP